MTRRDYGPMQTGIESRWITKLKLWARPIYNLIPLPLINPFIDSYAIEVLSQKLGRYIRLVLPCYFQGRPVKYLGVSSKVSDDLTRLLLICSIESYFMNGAIDLSDFRKKCL